MWWYWRLIRRRHFKLIKAKRAAENKKLYNKSQKQVRLIYVYKSKQNSNNNKSALKKPLAPFAGWYARENYQFFQGVGGGLPFRFPSGGAAVCECSCISLARVHPATSTLWRALSLSPSHHLRPSRTNPVLRSPHWAKGLMAPRMNRLPAAAATAAVSLFLEPDLKNCESRLCWADTRALRASG